MVSCPFCSRHCRIAAIVDAIQLPAPHDPELCYRWGGKLRPIEKLWPLPAKAESSTASSE
jgi:hypothetical protein